MYTLQQKNAYRALNLAFGLRSKIKVPQTQKECNALIDQANILLQEENTKEGQVLALGQGLRFIYFPDTLLKPFANRNVDAEELDYLLHEIVCTYTRRERIF